MLRQEDAEARLEQWKLKDGATDQAARIKKLPAPDRDIAQRVMAGRHGSVNVDGNWQDNLDRWLQSLAELDALPVDRRLSIFEALLPQMPLALEALWQFGKTLPYQSDYTRKAFRDPGATLEENGGRVWLLANSLRDYNGDVVWLAEWAPYVASWSMGDAAGTVFAAVIEAGGPIGERVLQIMLQSARGEHPTGGMGRHLTRALLNASRPEGWECIEKLLLNAQREEGLRQVILETCDEAHPEAFRRLVSLIVEHRLGRFSAVARAVDVWFGFGFEGGDEKGLYRVLNLLLPMLGNDDPMREAAPSGDPERLYLALWVTGHRSARAAIAAAEPFLTHSDVAVRYAAVRLLNQIGLSAADPLLARAIGDPDLRIATTAAENFCAVWGRKTSSEVGAFEHLEALLPRMPKAKQTMPGIIWPWGISVDRAVVGRALVSSLGLRPVERLLPHLAALDADARAHAARKMREAKSWTPETRAAFIRLTGDAATQVRDQALQAVKTLTLSEGEAQSLEGLLTRKADDLRRGILTALVGQPDEAALASADRLTAAKDAQQQWAGLELLRTLSDAGRSREFCRARAQAFAESHPNADAAAQTQLDAILRADENPPSLEDALGLMNPAGRTRVVPLSPRSVHTKSAAAARLVASLDDLIHAHREEPIELIYAYQETRGEKELLGNVKWGFPQPNPEVEGGLERDRLPLAKTWLDWWHERGPTLRDADGLELLRALALLAGALFGTNDEPEWRRDTRVALLGVRPKLRYDTLVHNILNWIQVLEEPPGAVDFMLDAAEASAAAIPTAAWEPEKLWYGATRDWRDDAALTAYLSVAVRHRGLLSDRWSNEQSGRLWRLQLWMDRPVFDAPPLGILGKLAGMLKPPPPTHPIAHNRPSLDDVLRAMDAGAATEDDLLDHLLGPRSGAHASAHFNDLRMLSGRKADAFRQARPGLEGLMGRIRRRIVELEVTRGSGETATSAPAAALRHSGGAEELFKVVRALGTTPFTRGWTGGAGSRADTLSHLVRHTYPGESDSFARFKEMAEAAGLKANKLIEIGMYAPQWAAHVEQAVGWESLASAIWWVQAHTRDDQWSVDAEIRETWVAEVAEHTPLTGQDLTDGAVDPAWFRRVYSALGPERWATVDAAAKYASTSGGHKRAQLFADAMLGRVTEAELMKRITEKRNQEAVRALGLLEIASDRGALLRRYQAFKEFERGSRQFGSMKQESEKKAARIGLENLARTAGYPDPIRLSWAMEASGVADLGDGPIVVEAGGVRFSLAIDDQGRPEFAMERNGKPLKTMPAAQKKDPQVTALKARVTEIRRQASRMRQSLEQAMIRGDAFRGEELADLAKHPVLYPMLRSLVLLGARGAGYLTPEGTALEGFDGVQRGMGPEETVRVAHPHDLLERGDWHDWQRDCFRRERVQPFKQVFRELYVLTDAEVDAAHQSRRYAGQQVQPKQAVALLRSTGWVAHPEEGTRRTFHDEKLTACIDTLGLTFTGADVEGVTLEGVYFTSRGTWAPVPPREVPPRVFSEVMRDLDLVVSVAHVSGVDPEATTSTVEMRAALIHETSALLGLDNVTIKERWAMIAGRLGDYTLHLGSGTVHRQPGGAVCIVPVHAAHRGRLFLPFADDDPKTAEVLAKTLLLARDYEIKDPSILEQLRG